MIRKAGVGIVDYGSGNIASLRSSLQKIGYRPLLLQTAHDFEQSKVIVIPGVGAFPQAMNQLRQSGLDHEILKAHNSGARIVGICVGMQLLAEMGHEITPTKGLGLIPGQIRAHPDGLQVGWLPLKGLHRSYFTDKRFYFNHSYYLDGPDDTVVYRCQQLSIAHPAVVRRGNVTGIQFHPEKSQHDGLTLLSHVIQGKLS